MTSWHGNTFHITGICVMMASDVEFSSYLGWAVDQIIDKQWFRTPKRSCGHCNVDGHFSRFVIWINLLCQQKWYLRTLECTRSNNQGQGQAITPHRCHGLKLRVLTLDTYSQLLKVRRPSGINFYASQSICNEYYFFILILFFIINIMR